MEQNNYFILSIAWFAETQNLNINPEKMVQVKEMSLVGALELPAPGGK